MRELTPPSIMGRKSACASDVIGEQRFHVRFLQTVCTKYSWMRSHSNVSWGAERFERPHQKLRNLATDSGLCVHGVPHRQPGR